MAAPAWMDRADYRRVLARLESEGRLPEGLAPAWSAAKQRPVAPAPARGAPTAAPPPAVRRPLPCVHLDDGHVIEECRCADPWQRRLKNTHECERGHGDKGIVSRLRDCAHCPDYRPRDPFRSPPDPTLPAGWWDDEHTVRIVADGADALLRDPPTGPPFAPAGREGRGVVIAGGGKYWPSVYVTVRLLRELGRWEGPVQVWYFGGRGEFDGWYQDRLDELSLPGGRVECLDADGMREVFPARILNGYEVKSYAVHWSGFREVLWLDADSYPVAPVAPLFDCPLYRERGALFWPDLELARPWMRWGQWGCGPDAGWPWETGQYLVDLGRHGDAWALARYYDDRSDCTYRWGFGDTGTVRAAFARAGRPVGFFGPAPVWHGHSYVHAGADGGPQFVHRTRNKLTLAPTGFYTPQHATTFQALDLPGETRVAALVAELRSRRASP